MKRHNHRILFACGYACAVLVAALVAFGQESPPHLVAEYRIDGGTAQPMNLVAPILTPRYWEGEFTAAASATNLSVGPHWLEVRMKGTNDVWSEWQGQWFRVTGETHLTAAEWFIDRDPGEGKATPIAQPADGAWDEPQEDFEVENVGVEDLSVGRHSLVIRAKDSNGDWGITSSTVFYVGEPMRLVAAEWTTDPNAEPGIGHPMKPADGTFDQMEEDLIATSDTTALGPADCAPASIYIRVKDSLGRWSSRGGLVWDAVSGAWKFDAALGWTDARGFIRVVPALAANPSPAHESMATNRPLVLKWDKSLGASEYNVYLWQDGTPPDQLLSRGLTNSSLQVSSPLAPYATYRWRVRAMGAPDCYSDGPVWRFTLGSPDDKDSDRMPDAWEAQFFGSAANADLTTDHDSDGLLDWQEFVAGTNPTNRLDFFRLDQRLVGQTPPLVALDWQTVTSRVYTVYGTTNLAANWTVLQTLNSTGTKASYTNQTAGSTTTFFRVGVDMQPVP